MVTTRICEWQATRAAGLSRLRGFVPFAGESYAMQRNYDDGPGDRSNVSCLSPWIRHRLILEEEVLDAVLGMHSKVAGEKFIQELCWHIYWKGWLEMRPDVWHEYRRAIDRLHNDLPANTALLDRLERAIRGATGIECFDEWVRELAETGYLHNHARMWFASIWIFTLELPWELGADFFLRHLLDGDAAANTLSWRWVAGLQTPGKVYAARAGNIEKYTHGRFHPRGQLCERIEPVTAPAAPPGRPLPETGRPVDGLRSGLLLTEDDLCIKGEIFDDISPVAVAGITFAAGRSQWPVSRRVAEFSEQAVIDGLTRAAARYDLPPGALCHGETAACISDWCLENNLEQLLVPYVPVGVSQDGMRQVQSELDRSGIRLVQLRRSLDNRLWPCATHGFFRFRKAISQLVDSFRKTA